MPRGTRRELKGLLLTADRQPILQMSDGGQWRLEMAGRFSHLLGRRVRVIGMRDEFDLIAVETIEQA